jgi:hypothetical protein
MPAAQAATQFFLFPTSVLQAGQTYGPQVSAPVAGVYSSYQVSVQQMGLWPAGDCLQLQIDYSQDGGTTWRADMSTTLQGGVWKDKTGATVTSGVIGVTMGTLNPGVNQQVLTTAIADLFRVTVYCLQSCAAILEMGGTP